MYVLLVCSIRVVEQEKINGLQVFTYLNLKQTSFMLVVFRGSIDVTLCICSVQDIICTYCNSVFTFSDRRRASEVQDMLGHVMQQA